MNELEKQIMEISETVLTIEIYHDVKVTVQETEFIKNRIKDLNFDFYKNIENNENSFSFGEKYFAPINDKHCLCIPKDSDTMEIYNLIDNELFFSKIIEDFLHNFLFKDYLNGYFNITKNK